MTTQWPGMQWLHPPPHVAEQPDGALEVQTAPGSDFWRHTQYGFVRDSGHALLRPAPREWTATVTVSGEYGQLYDQAGLMLHTDEERWMKLGVEYVGRQQWSAVVTRGFSDWSVLPADTHPAVTFRCVRRGDALILHARPSLADPWTLLRVAPYPPTLDAQVGVMACSPGEAGFRVRFSDFVLGEADRRPLHELTRP
ncbi:DUF1349 domain-containing protein [Deinococcus koreensis]|nr:DUF1349 domain-containing protein [Deinococcus koreensis]